MSKKKYYRPEYKQAAVRLAEVSGNKRQVARDLGVHATMTGNWQRELQAGGKRLFPGHGKPPDEEMNQLKKESRHLQRRVACVGLRTGRPETRASSAQQ